MAAIRKIFTFILIGIFLVPAAGLYYTRHSCMKSGDVRIVFDADYTCCAGDALPAFEDRAADGSAGGAACGRHNAGPVSKIEAARDNCCSSESEYLKTKEEYTCPEKDQVPDFELQLTIAEVLPGLSPSLQLHAEENSHSPPCTLSSRKILLQNGVLLI